MTNTTQVHAPYHFVPLSKWIYMPDWAHLVSHDVPFKDGYSGVIEYTLTNATPLMVGGDQEKRNGQPALIKWARDPNGQAVIPGSSLKGMIRNVLEIATFAKFSAIDDNHFSYRDVSSRSHYLEKVIKPNTVKAGWLKYNTAKQNWELSTCEWAKIKHSAIEESLKITINNEEKAIDKYKKQPLSKKLNFEVVVKEGKQGKVNWVTDLGKGQTEGFLVCGNKRVIGQGKADDYEFSYCFYGQPELKSIESNHLNNIVSKMFISHDDKHIEYLNKNQNTEYGIPVFALFEKSSNRLHSIGLSKMPRVLYKNSVSDLADVQQNSARTSAHYFDMAELILGTIRDEGLSLKSRVFFSDGQLTKDTGYSISNDVILNSPKATFCAAYLEQPMGKLDKDYDDSHGKLSGWKRYFAASEFKANQNTSDNTDVKTQLELLNPNSEFNGRIVFHNLKKEELGALLWVLQLGNQEQAKRHYHGLGHGKSLGAGAVQFTLNLTTITRNEGSCSEQIDAQDFINHFTYDISSHYSDNQECSWVNSVQIRHLLAIANIKLNQSRDLSYMPLEEFKNVKNAKNTLTPIVVDDTERTGSAKFSPQGTLSFSSGRLSALITNEDKSTLWYNEQISKRNKTEREIQAKVEAREQAKNQALEVEKLSLLSEDERNIEELKRALKKMDTIDGKREFNAKIEAYIMKFISDNVNKEAAQRLYDLANDKSYCEYLNIKNPKKSKLRKAKLTELAAKYNIKGPQ